MLRFIVLLLLTIPLFIYSNITYPPLQNAYQLELSGGIGTTYDKTFAQSFSLNGTADFLIIESFGLGLSDYIFYNPDKQFFGNYFALDLLMRPMFAFRFIKNQFSKDYPNDYLWNTITLRIGGVFQTFEIEDDLSGDFDFTIGVQMGFSGNILLDYSKNHDLFLKFTLMYHFLQSRTITNNHYDFDGFYLSMMVGGSFRFGDSIEWLVGPNPNKPLKVEYLK